MTTMYYSDGDQRMLDALLLAEQPAETRTNGVKGGEKLHVHVCRRY